MTEPTRDEVRAWLEERTLIRDASLAQRALALLEEGEKDRERLDALQALTETDDLVLWVRENEWCVEVVDAGQKHRGATLRAAIDRMRGI